MNREIFDIIGNWSKKQVLTTMGVLNAYLYRAAIDTLSLKKEGNHHRVTNRLKSIAQHGVECFNLTQQALSTYLKKYWSGAAAGKTTLWKMRDMLADVFGIFHYQKQRFRPGEKKRGTAPDIESFDLVRALILYEYLEEFYCWRWHAELEDLPKHRGAIVRLLFNAVFQGVTQFRRKLLTGDETPTLQPKDIPVYWEKGISYNIFGEPCCYKPTEYLDALERGDTARSRLLYNL
jgi:hypothetical protein